MIRYSKYFLQNALWLDDGFCQYYVQDDFWGLQEILDVETLVFFWPEDACQWLQQCAEYDHGGTLHRNTQSYAKTSETLVHEGVHAMGVGGSKRAEALARLAEAQHRGDKINSGKMRKVPKDIKDAHVYDNMPWRKGGTSEHFPGLEF